MDNYENQLTVFNRLDDIAEAFDNLFDDISPIGKHGKRSKVGLPKGIRIQRDALSLEQREEVKHLSGFIKSALEAINAIRFSDTQEEQADINSRLREMEKLLEIKDKHARRDARTISILQEFLVQELTRADELESRIKEKEQDLVKQTDLLMQTQKRNGNMSSVPDSLRAKSTNIHDLLMKYVYKKFGKQKFFGLIVDFDEKWFRVVYEDADEEDLGKAEIIKNLWMGDVPSLTKEQCEKHHQSMKERYAKASFGNSLSAGMRITATTTEKETVVSVDGARSRSKGTPASNATDKLLPLSATKRDRTSESILDTRINKFRKGDDKSPVILIHSDPEASSPEQSSSASSTSPKHLSPDHSSASSSSSYQSASVRKSGRKPAVRINESFEDQNLIYKALAKSLREK